MLVPFATSTSMGRAGSIIRCEERDKVGKQAEGEMAVQDQSCEMGKMHRN